jgi:ArsR family transcriptional regulator, arsenate/arsenite/antimonite-responsive transcriptional repressor
LIFDRGGSNCSGVTDTQLARIAKALADGRRFAILEMVAATEGECPCKRVVATFPVSQATISHHIKELATAGLIEVRREAQQAYLRYRPETMAAYLAAIGRRLPGRPARPRKRR